MIVQHGVSSSPYRTLAIIWTRAALVGALILGTAALAPRVLGRLEQNRDRDELALVNERQQRAAGELVVLPSGQVRRAEAYARSPDWTHRRGALTGSGITWAGFLAALVILDAIFQTYRLVRDEPHVDRTATML